MRDEDQENSLRREHHNALERKRRDEIKDCFIELRESLPTVRGQSASRYQILKSAADFIQLTSRKKQEAQQDIVALERQNDLLLTQIRTIENVLRQHAQNKESSDNSVESNIADSDSDDDDEDDGEDSDVDEEEEMDEDEDDEDEEDAEVEIDSDSMDS